MAVSEKQLEANRQNAQLGGVKRKVLVYLPAQQERCALWPTGWDVVFIVRR